MAVPRVLTPLPIDSLLPEILESLSHRHPNLILKASPGTGKTTRVPPALLRAEFRASDDREILVLEPRRLAAKYAARRVAEEQGCRLGGRVGYQFRLENATSSETRLRFLTEGMLMRRLLGSPELPDVAAVVLDEFHERHLHGDVALAYLRHLQLTARPDLRLVVMSATLETEALSAFLGDAPVLAIDARLHPVRIEHLKSPGSKTLERMVAEGVREALEKSPGDVLVFLPGMAEIRRAEQALAGGTASDRGLSVLALHGELSREEQDRAMSPDPAGRRKVILSTNLAETSLTIEGVTAVVDSGLHRVASYSWWSGVPTLRTRPVSRASAIQRAGRAGRTAPGYCLRLYTAGEFEGRPPFETPEVRRAELTQTLLELKSMGILEPAKFDWFEPPAAASIEAAEKLLRRLGAATPGGTLTELGRRLAEIPAHPRLGRMLLEACRMGPALAEEAALLAAQISEGGPNSRDSLDALAGLRGAARDSRLLRVRDLFLSFVRGKSAARLASGSSPGDQPADLRFALLTGFPDRVARKRALPGQKGQTATEFDLVFSSGGSARVSAAPVLSESDTFVALDVQERQGAHQQRAQAYVHSLCPIPSDWLLELEPSPITEITEVLWDDEREAVVCTYQMRYDELVLLEEPQAPRGSPSILGDRVLGLDLAAVPAAPLAETMARLANRGFGEQFEATISRLSLVRAGGYGGAELAAALSRILAEFTRAAEVRALDWPASLVEDAELQEPGIAARLERLAPTHFTFPGGRRSRIHYRLNQGPWLESRIQDFFGIRQSPSILGGKLALTLHLLAPNQRAVQVTQDLAGFWERHYPEIRKQLARRYPRHSWPENPAK